MLIVAGAVVAYRLNDGHFLEVVAVIERICTELGEALFADDCRKRAYQTAKKIAAYDKVKLYDLPESRAA